MYVITVNALKDCKDEWKFKFTFYGYCLEFNNDTTSEPKPKISVGRQTSLSFLFGYNNSDWTNGWMAAFDGFTVFYRFLNAQDLLWFVLYMDMREGILLSHISISRTA